MEIVDNDSVTHGTQEKERYGMEALQPPNSSITEGKLDLIFKIFSKWNWVDCYQKLKQLNQ